MPPPLCESCPCATSTTFFENIQLPRETRRKIKKVLEGQRSENAMLRVLIAGIILHLFGRDAPDLGTETIRLVHERLELVWNLGNRGLSCATHGPVSDNGGISCLRKNLMEEEMTFFRKCWNESKKNEERFQTLLQARGLAGSPESADTVEV